MNQNHIFESTNRRAREGIQGGPLSGRLRSRDFVGQNRPSGRSYSGKKKILMLSYFYFLDRWIYVKVYIKYWII